MKKLTDARNFLLKSGLGIKAKELLTFAEKGTVRCLQGNSATNANFQINYVAHLILTDFAGNPEDLLFLMTKWVDDNCPDRDQDALEFHVDIINTKAADVSIKVNLSETTVVVSEDNGTRLDYQRDADVRDIDMGTYFPGLT
jgi:hypothetical protein